MGRMTPEQCGNRPRNSGIRRPRNSPGLGYVDLVRLFLDRGAEVNASSRGGTPLHCALASRRVEITKLLVARGADVALNNGPCGRAPLHMAVREGSPMEIVKLLLENGADVNALDGNRATPLHEACWHRDRAMAAFLIERGAELEVKDIQGRTPLSVARREEEQAIVKLLEELATGE